MRHLLVALLGIAACPLAWGSAAADTPKELLHSCEAVISAAGPTAGHTVDIPAAGLPCWYYMSAMQNMSALVDERGERLLGICPSADSTVLDYVRVFVQYAHRNRKEVYENAAVLAFLGLSEAFPCGGPSGH
jgi:Rap1a immunity proteins